ncbi:MAG: hydroxyacylglutathione hydrolase [Hyphococcus sp.]|nr:MAG: hydroxyacylglutathione hydrolase [Marinicaulis sp.]
MALEILQIPCLSDNYGYLIRDGETGETAAIDTPDVNAINQALGETGWTLTYIFNTHHHWDHAGGNLALKEQWSCEIIGPKAEADRIPGLDRAVGQDDVVMLGKSSAIIYDTPGHTSGHIVYHFEEDGAAFVGDTIFAMGCGRLFEGTPAQMWASLSKIASMPKATKLYCAHEYTQANAAFALSVDPHNEALKKRAAEVDQLRAAGTPTVPTDVARELATNPFLRAEDKGLQAALELVGSDPVEVFAETRRRKDNF